MLARIGTGYDAHRLVKGRKLILGGVEVAFEKGLAGHSDADVVCHAIADALLGAAGAGDLGKHFPDTDERWAGISSLRILERVCDLLGEKGVRIANIDATIIIEKPRLGPYVQDMRQRLAGALNLNPEQVSVKAKTTEGMGFEGTGEGASCQAVALVETLPGG
jgi:2-C-methyl-D-erythritol 2,4-cyclodiphosphate synthase